MKCDICGIEANWILDEKSYCSKHHKEKIGGTMTESKSEEKELDKAKRIRI